MPEPILADPPTSKLRAYVQLFRLPNVFTALADVLMGFLFTHDPERWPINAAVPLLICSALLYTAGMTLNDVFDIEVDRGERPHRPLPSGRISLTWARWIGVEMLLLGMAIGVAQSFWFRDWRCGAVSIALAAMVVLYNRVLKKTPVGPVGMGACRFLNVLLGMSLSPAPWNSLNYLVAGGVGLYIVGVTWFARGEADPESRRWQLGFAMLVMYAGMALLALVPRFLPQEIEPKDLAPLLVAEPQRWLWFWLLLAMLVGWRCLRAIVRPYPEFVQEAVKQSIMSLILLDAVVCVAVRDASWSLMILALMIPMTLLGRWSYST